MRISDWSSDVCSSDLPSRSSASGADDAINAMDAALASVNTTRAQLGAVQNRFESVVSNLATTTENLSAARSRIQDTDYAAETANMTRAQIDRKSTRLHSSH